MNAYYIDESGKPRKIKGGFIGIDGKARKIKKGFIGVDDVARLCFTSASYDPVFANNTWDSVIVACQSNNVPDSWNVGDQLTMTIGGTDYAIDIIGKNHDDYADGSGKAPLTFQLHDCYETKYAMNQTASNIGGWDASTMRKTHMMNILSSMPVQVRNAIKEVEKTTSIGNTNDVLRKTHDKLFILSEVEIFNAITYSVAGEGNQYEYYRERENRIKKLNDNACAWWQRSSNITSNSFFCLCSVSGTVHSASSVNPEGVSFAFCF